MNHPVAYKLLIDELKPYRNLSFEELSQLIGENSTRLVKGSDNVDYQLTIIVQLGRREDRISVTGFIGEANWGGPNDRMDEFFTVSAEAPRRLGDFRAPA